MTIRLFYMLTIILNWNLLVGQKSFIHGSIKDFKSSDPLGGALIQYAPDKAISADPGGNYIITVPNGDCRLIITYVGYKPDTINCFLNKEENKEINITLKPTSIQLDQVESVSQYKKNSNSETVSTDVINREQVKDWNSNDLGEALQHTSGVLVQDGQISIRGGSSWSYGVGSHTAVLQDGMSMESPDWDASLNTMVAVENVKQIEVIKGASSVVYGSSALDGVVNVITQWPTKEEPVTEIDQNFTVCGPPKLKAQQWWISPPFQENININHQEKFKHLEVIVAGNLTATKGFATFSDQFRMRTSFKIRYIHPKIEGLNFGVNGSLNYEKREEFFISKDLDSNAYVSKISAFDQFVRTNLDPFMNYSKSAGKLNHSLSVTWRYMEIYRTGNGNDINSIANQLSLDNSYQLKYKDNMIVLTTGMPLSFGYSRSSLYSGLRSNLNYAGFAQIEFNYKILSIQGGLRYEMGGVDKQFIYSAPVFRGGINLHVATATWLRASWGQGFRVPSIGEKYVSSDFADGLLVIPNDTLHPEHGWNMEVGIRQGMKIGNWIAGADVCVFYQQYTNFIEMQLGVYPNAYSNGGPIFPASLEFPPNSGELLGLRGSNVAEARIAGYEVGFKSGGPLGPITLNLMAGYTYTWPTQVLLNAEGKNTYSLGQDLSDMFKYTYTRITDPYTQSKLLYWRLRHMVKADVEIDYWKAYFGFDLNYGTVPEKIPPLFQAASTVLFGNGNAIQNYLSTRTHGDYWIDARAGFKINSKARLGVIVTNLTNRFYELRPGIPEAPRRYAIQFRYTF